MKRAQSWQSTFHTIPARRRVYRGFDANYAIVGDAYRLLQLWLDLFTRRALGLMYGSKNTSLRPRA